MKLIQVTLLSFLMINVLSAQIVNPDLSFGTDGIVQEDHGMYISSVAVQEDGKILLTGMVANFVSDTIVIIRYNEDGSLDDSFGIDGRVEKGISSFSQVNDIIVLENGDIMLSGSMFQAAFMAKLDSDGNFKSDFGGDGIMQDLDIQSDFQKAIMYLTEDEEIYLLHGYTQGGVAAPAISKWTTDGDRITDFGSNGERQFDRSYGTEPIAIDTDKDNNVYALYREGSLIKMDQNGNLDTNFGTDGYLLFGPGQSTPGTYTGLKIQEDQIFLHGFDQLKFYVWKINTAGDNQNDFGNNGILNGQWDGLHSSAYGIYLLEDNSILVGGEMRVDNMLIDLCLVKYDESGALDNSFATNGILKTELDGTTRARVYSRNKPGTILLAGTQNVWPEQEFYFAAFRYTIDQTLDNKDLEAITPQISIYPNPVANQVKLSFPNRRVISYEIVDLHGKILKSVKEIAVANSMTIKIGNMSTGNYLLNLVFEGGFSSTHKLIKKK